MDTYKIGTVANSESTMHKLTKDAKSLSLDDFQVDSNMEEYILDAIKALQVISENPHYDNEVQRLRHLKQALPTSYLQKRHWSANYEIVRNIVNQRANHRLEEWHTDFINWARTLPYSDEFIFRKLEG